MINIEIGNSECKITGVDAATLTKLKDVLSYTTAPAMNYYTKSFSTSKRTLMSKQGVFPTGLLNRLTDYLESNNIYYTATNLRIKPERLEMPFKLNLGYTPYLSQTKAAWFANFRGRGIIVAPTGLGKSTIIAMIIANIQVKTLIVVPNLELKRQLSASLEAAFGSLKHITVENIDSPRLNKLKGFDMLIIDEFHHSAAKTYRKLNKTAWSSIYYKFGMTATPFRSQDSENMLLESVLSNVIYEISYQDAVKAGQIVPMEVYYYELPKQTVKGHTWAQVYNELIVKNESRNTLIHEILLSLSTQNISTLCLVKEISHGEDLAKRTNFTFANGTEEQELKIAKINLFNRKVKNILIGTTGVLGEGVDTKPAEYVIIAGLGKSRNAFMQQVGRGFRVYPNKTSCKVILFKDRSHKWTLNHFKEQCKTLLEEFGVVPVKIS